MECPKCGLVNPETALMCDCGYTFKKSLEDKGTIGILGLLIGRGETAPSKIADLFETDLSKLSEDELRSYLRTSVKAGQKMYREGRKEEGDKYKAKVSEIIARGREITREKVTAEKARAKLKHEDKIEKTEGKIALDYGDKKDMGKLNDIFTELDNIPIKLIIKVSMKWAIGLLPFLIFLWSFIAIMLDLFLPKGFRR